MPVVRKEYHEVAGVTWRVWQNEGGGYSYDALHLVLLMDIREELKRLNSLLSCHRFVGIPTTLNKIAKNTTKKKPAARKSAASNS